MYLKLLIISFFIFLLSACVNKPTGTKPTVKDFRKSQKQSFNICRKQNYSALGWNLNIKGKLKTELSDVFTDPQNIDLDAGVGLVKKIGEVIGDGSEDLVKTFLGSFESCMQKRHAEYMQIAYPDYIPVEIETCTSEAKSTTTANRHCSSGCDRHADDQPILPISLKLTEEGISDGKYFKDPLISCSGGNGCGFITTSSPVLAENNTLVYATFKTWSIPATITLSAQSCKTTIRYEYLDQ